MKTVNVKFTVAMDAEAKKAGDVKTVEFECSFEGVDEDTITKHAVANMVVAWQSQIRNNWEKFIKGELPKAVTFGVPLFEGRGRAAATITPEGIKAFLNKKMQEEGWTMEQCMNWLNQQ